MFSKTERVSLVRAASLPVADRANGGTILILGQHIGQHDMATGSGLLFGSSNCLASAAPAMLESADAKDKLAVTTPKPACCSQRSAAKEI